MKGMKIRVNNVKSVLNKLACAKNGESSIIKGQLVVVVIGRVRQTPTPIRGAGS